MPNTPSSHTPPPPPLPPLPTTIPNSSEPTNSSSYVPSSPEPSVPAPPSTPIPTTLSPIPTHLFTGFEEPPEPTPWESITTPYASEPIPVPEPVPASSLLTPDALSFEPVELPNTKSTFITVPNSPDTIEVVFYLETVDGSEVVIQNEIVSKCKTEHEFYKNIKNIVEEIHIDNDDIEIVPNFSVYVSTYSYSYYTKLMTFYYKTYWFSKLAKDKLLITNHEFGNKPFFLTLEMKNALKN